MKNIPALLMIILLCVAGFGQVETSYAQDTALNTILVLSDANPTISLQVAIPAGTQGVIRLELIDVSVAVLNANNEQVLTATSSTIREIEILFGADSAAHSMTIQRLPNVVNGYLRVSAAPAMSITGLTLNPAVVGLTPEHPQGLLPLDFSLAAAGVLEIQRVENAAFTQVLLPDSTSILSLHSPAIERLRVILTAGSYQLQLDNIAAYPTVQAQVETAALAQASALMQPIAVTSAAACTGTVNFERVNQRSGAGVQYTITGEAIAGEVLPVGGWDTTKTWALVGTAYGSGWMSASYLNFAGDCMNLPVY